MKRQTKDYLMAVRVLGVAGAINFLDYGGMLVVENQGQIEGWNFYPDPENESSAWLNRFELERFKLVGDVALEKDVYVPEAYDNSWNGRPFERDEWWFDKVAEMCQSADVSRDDFWESVTAENPVKRAWAYETIGSYFGFHELSGGSEETIRIPEWRKRLALPCYRARQRGITVYT